MRSDVDKRLEMILGEIKALVEENYHLKIKIAGLEGELWSRDFRRSTRGMDDRQYVEPANPRPSLESLKTNITQAVNALARFQESCPHVNFTKEACSNTGNYEPSADRYWYEFRCSDCDKFWSEDQ